MNKKMHCSGKIILFIMGLSSSAAMAGTMGSEVKARNWVVTVSGGHVWANGGETQTFYLAEEIEKTYLARKSNSILPEGELFLGVQKSLANQFQAQLGVAVAVAGNAKMSGEIWDDADPQFNNYIYSYRVGHAHVALKGKLLADRGYFVTPWISGAIGVGFNRASGFTNTPVIFEAVVNPNFSARSQTAFTYTLGAGVQKALNQNWQVGIGYEFADWGKSQLGRASEQTLNSGLKLDHLYTNGVLLNVTYIV